MQVMAAVASSTPRHTAGAGTTQSVPITNAHSPSRPELVNDLYDNPPRFSFVTHLTLDHLFIQSTIEPFSIDMASTVDNTNTPWWKDAVVYQIYPASFQDSNDDGIGDIPGISSRLDYIQSLGVNTIWICPMYASPQIDMGYDISDYQKVHPPYGTVQDMEKLIEQTHSRGMKILLDLVINHTSDQHDWFQEARSSKENPKRDWYIWRPAKYDDEGNRQPPNNWRAFFGGSVWEWDEGTQEYYLHLFAVEQPDLNFENPETRKAVYDSAMVFWLDKGIDGFRIDTVNMYSKPSDYPDAKISDTGAFLQDASSLFVNGPRMDEYLHEMNEILGRYNAVSVGECPCTPDLARVRRYVSAKEKQMSMVCLDRSDSSFNHLSSHLTGVPIRHCRRRHGQSLQISDHASQLQTHRSQACHCTNTESCFSRF
jgi:hypothetical protein